MIKIKIFLFSLSALSIAVAAGVWLVLAEDSARVQELRKADIARERKAIEEAKKAHQNPFIMDQK
jgi:hypothetical protein